LSRKVNKKKFCWHIGQLRFIDYKEIEYILRKKIDAGLVASTKWETSICWSLNWL